MLAAKGIEHECVNINLKDKPEWFFELNPVGKVPVIELPGGKVIYESAICCGKGQGFEILCTGQIRKFFHGLDFRGNLKTVYL